MRIIKIPLVVSILVVSSGCLIATTTPSPKPPPEKSETLTNESVLNYVQQFERGYIWNSYRADYQGVTVGTMNATILNATDDTYVVHLEYTVALEGSGSSGDEGITVNYYVTDSITKRYEADTWGARGPDPANGTVVANET
jgi:hypothetical protein